MTAGSESSGEQLRCPRCGADLSTNAYASLCWLCGTKLSDYESVAAAVARLRPPVEKVGSYSFASLMLFVTLASVVMGVVSFAPGLGIPLGIVLFLVWLRTAAVVSRRRALGRPVTLGEKVVLFLQSIGTVVVLIMLTQIAMFAAAVAACFVMLGTGAIGNETAMWLMIICVGIVTVVVVIGNWVVVIRERWQRDTSGDYLDETD